MIYKPPEHFLSGQESCVPSVGVCVGEAGGVAAKPQLVKKKNKRKEKSGGPEAGWQRRPGAASENGGLFATCLQICAFVSALIRRTAEPLRKQRGAEVILPAGGFFQRRLFM